MRILLIAAVVVSSATFALTGCTDVESPWKLAREKIDDRISIELSANNLLRLEGRRVDPNSLSSELARIGINTPGRPVALIMGDGADERAIPSIKGMAKNAGLGDVLVTTSAKMRQRGILTANGAKPEPEPTPAAATPAPEQKPAPAPAAPEATPAPAPEAAAAPAPAPAPVAAAPAPEVTAAVQPLVVEALKNGNYKVAGQEIAAADLAFTLNAAGASSPGRLVDLYQEPDVPFQSLNAVRVAAGKAGLGKVTVK